MKPSDYLRFYAERFHTVEVDSTFYACPTARTVGNWNARTPNGFVDIQMPVLNGLQAAREIFLKFPKMLILILSKSH